MIKIDDSYLEDEIRDGFYIPSMTKRTWAMELTVLSLIDEICTRHNIKYFADWGTFLGAVRHGGFIPWDDDFDLCMHRNEFERFREAAAAELPDGYSIMSFHNNDYSWKFIYNVVPNDHMCFTPEYLSTHYSFPYIVAVDIFIIDNISDDPKLEEERNRQIRDLLSRSDHIIPDSQNNTDKKRALYEAAEKLLMAEDTNDTKRIMQKVPWAVYDRRSFPREYYDDFIRVPFEMTTIPVPRLYHRVLTEKYGNYMNIVIGTGGHDYPYYIGQLAALGEEFEYPVMYKFSEADLDTERDFSTSLKAIAADIVEYIAESVDVLRESSGAADVLDFLADIQDNVVAFGTLTEKIKGEGTKTVAALERFCEKLYELSVVISSLQRECMPGGENNINNYSEQSADDECAGGANTSAGGDTYCRIDTVICALASIASDINTAIDAEIINRRFVLFLPVQERYFDSLRKMYERESLNENTDVYVMPLPYYYKNYDGSLKPEVHYDWINNSVIDTKHLRAYDDFDISLLCPDVIYINLPYDEYNMALSVPPAFYARSIRKYTQKLIYVPFFKSAEFDMSVYPCAYNMKYYCCMPGVVMADEVYVQSEGMRNNYIDKLTEWSGGHRDVWERKICVQPQMPDAVGAQGNNKKTILWYVNVSVMLEYGEAYFDKMRRSLRIFTESRDSVEVILATDTYTDEVLREKAPKLYEMWHEFTGKFAAAEIGMYLYKKETQSDLGASVTVGCDTKQNQCAGMNTIAGADAYYGDPSIVCKDYILSKKPVMIQNVVV